MKNREILLNKEQEKAVTHSQGPLLIIAGAGTGKTTVVTERIKYLISQGLAKPEQILALTFTEKAAQQMEKRVDIALPYGTFGLWISTFHSFCDRILRSEALNIGLLPNFKLLTEAESYLLLKKNFWQLKLNYFRPNGNPYKFIEGLLQHFARLKDEDISTENYINFTKNQYKDGASEVKKEETDKYLELALAYKIYEELKIKEGVMDFSDLISNTLKLFRSRNSVLVKYQKQFKYILVDEFQDTNYAQYQLVKLLAPPDAQINLAVVGDDSQSIYKFRGAAISNILSFMKDYPQAKNVILSTSYRCPQTILDAAYRLIKHNDPDTLEAQLGISKKLKSNENQPKEDRSSDEIEFIHTDRVEEEAEKIVSFINNYKSKNNKEYKDFAILVRANNHSEPFIRTLERARIPYQFLGPGMLFHKPEVKDLIAYLKVLYDFTDNLSLYRVLSMIIWKISARDLIAVINLAKKANISLFEQLEKLDEVGTIISDDSKAKIKKFIDLVHKQQKLIPKETAGQLLYYFLIDSGLLKQVINYKSQAEEERALNITRFFDKLKSFEATQKDASIFAVVDYLDLAMGMGESPLAAETDWTETNAVNLLTVHSAKGLEFPVIFLTNLIEGRFPSRDRKEQIPIPDKIIREVLPSGNYHLQEERRLFYVGITRAKEKLVFSAANYYGGGKRERKLSPFITEALGIDKQSPMLKYLPSPQIPLFEWQKTPESEEAKVEQISGKLKIDYLSYSAIESFRICPLHFKLRYILRLPTAPSAALSLGNSVHNALRDFYSVRRLNEGGSKSKELEFLLKLLDSNWQHLGFSGQDHEQETKQTAKEYLQNYLKSPLHKFARPIFIEKAFSFKVDPSLKILGKMDRIDDAGEGNIEIIDYKTGANLPNQNNLDNNLQMTIYALAAVNPGIFAKKIDQIKLSFCFFSASQKMSTVRTKEQLSSAVDELLKIRSEIEESDFKCSQGTICQNCEYKILCG